MKKYLAAFLGITLVCSAFFVGCGKSGKTEIVIDGGGVAGNYNSSINMTPSAANPNP